MYGFRIQRHVSILSNRCDLLMSFRECGLKCDRATFHCFFVEAGFALKHHEKNRLIFLFEPRNRNDKVPFDLTTFKYVLISQAAEIPNKVKAEIVAILRDTGAPI